jgi:6-phosphogluconolactonase
MKTIMRTAVLLTALLVIGNSFRVRAGEGAPIFLFTNDDQFLSANTTTGFSVVGITLTPIPGSPFLTGGTSNGEGDWALHTVMPVRISSRQVCVFVSDNESNDVAGFSMNRSSGVLTAASGSPYATGGTGNPNGIGLAATLDKHYLIAANSDSRNFSVLSIQADCSLVLDQMYPAKGVTSGMELTRDGKFLIVAYDDYMIDSYTIGPGATLSENGPFKAAGVADGVDITCNSRVAIFGDDGLETAVEAFQISANGTLTEVPGSPFKFKSGESSAVPVLNLRRDELFVSNQSSESVMALRLQSSLPHVTLVPGSPFASAGGGLPADMAVSPDGNTLFLASWLPNITVWQIQADGTIVNAPGSPVQTGRPTPALLSLAVFPQQTCTP